jgi:hypothetical protein
MNPILKVRSKITPKWLTSYFPEVNAVGIHWLAQTGQIDKVPRALLEQTLHLTDVAGNTTIHHICGTSSSLLQTPQEVLTEENLNVRGILGRTAIASTVRLLFS